MGDVNKNVNVTIKYKTVGIEQLPKKWANAKTGFVGLQKEVQRFRNSYVSGMNKTSTITKTWAQKVNANGDIVKGQLLNIHKSDGKLSGLEIKIEQHE